MQPELEALSSALAAAAAAEVLVVTGAGVSLASGIATFRGTDAGAVWANNVTTMGTRRFFQKDPAGSWKWYLDRFGALEGKLPNPAHFAIAALERWQLGRGGGFLLATQNIDLLHEAAGSREMAKVHGTADRFRCSRPGCGLGSPRGSIARAEVDLGPFLAAPDDATVPRCPRCGSRLRMHILWFDESYTEHDDYQFDRVQRAMRRASVVLFVGTSFSVGITDMISSEALGRKVPVFSIDPVREAPDARIHSISAPAEVALVELCAALGAALAAPPPP